MKRFIALITILCVLFSAGCGSEGAGADRGSAGTAVPDTALQESASEDISGTEAGNSAENENGSASGFVGSGDEKSDHSTESVAVSRSDMKQAKPFYERLCGKYTSFYSDEEYNTLEITEFGGNLYAQAGTASGDENSESLEPYSFWAVELLPENKDALISTDADECSFGLLRFSVMSNMSRYWASPQEVKIRLNEDGFEVEGLDAGKTVYVRDDRVQDAFPYTNKGDGDSADLIGNSESSGAGSDAAGNAGSSAQASDEAQRLVGLWREKDAETPVYLEFSPDGNIRLYRKAPGREVYLGCGTYEIPEDNRLRVNCSRLGYGATPVFFEDDYQRTKDALIIIPGPDHTGDDDIFPTDHSIELELTDPAEIPVVTLGDARAAGLDEEADYDAYDMGEKPFYGVWVSAVKGWDEAEETRKKLCAVSPGASILYSPDWENLNSEPYYCVTADRCKTKGEAEELLRTVKSAGYNNAYVKESGARISRTVYFTVFTKSTYEFMTDRVIIKAVVVENLDDGRTETRDLFVDEGTRFDKNCDISSFENYVRGDTPLQWMTKNKDMDPASEDPSKQGYALAGVFKATVYGPRIDTLISCGWWD